MNSLFILFALIIYVLLIIKLKAISCFALGSDHLEFVVLCFLHFYNFSRKIIEGKNQSLLMSPPALIIGMKAVEISSVCCFDMICPPGYLQVFLNTLLMAVFTSKLSILHTTEIIIVYCYG